MLQEHLDLFVALVGDVPPRDEREAMAASLVPLPQKSPIRIKWTGADGQHVLITAPDAQKISTVRDFDIIIWALSQINAQIERGNENPGATITFKAYDLLKGIRRGTSEGDYLVLKESLNRLRSTNIQVTTRREGRVRTEHFNLLTDTAIDEDALRRPRGMQITVPRWMYRAVMARSEVPAITPAAWTCASSLNSQVCMKHPDGSVSASRIFTPGSAVQRFMGRLPET